VSTPVLSEDSVYRIESRDRNGKLLAVLPYFNAQINLTINSTNKLRCSVPMDAQGISPATVDTGCWLWVFRYEVLIYTGIVWSITLDSGARMLGLNSEDAFSVLHWRYIFDPVNYTGAAWDVAFQLIQHSQAETGGNLGITHQHTNTGRKPYYPYDPNYVPPTTTVYDLPEPPSANSIEKTIADTLTKQTGGFEYTMSPNRVFQTFYPSMGARTLTYGADISNYSMQRFSSSLVNDGWFKAYDDSVRAVARIKDTASINTYGLFQRIQDLPDSPPTIEAVTAGGHDWMAPRVKRMLVPQISLRTPDEAQESISPVGLGDTFNLYIDDGYAQFFERMRCIGSESQETVVVYLNDLAGVGVDA
jgi:hypothetical protein